MTSPAPQLPPGYYCSGCRRLVHRVDAPSEWAHDEDDSTLCKTPADHKYPGMYRTVVDTHPPSPEVMEKMRALHPEQPMSDRPAPECREKGYCCGPNAFVAVCDCHDPIWEGEKWWEHGDERNLAVYPERRPRSVPTGHAGAPAHESPGS